jgi:hypothetical protein
VVPAPGADSISSICSMTSMVSGMRAREAGETSPFILSSVRETVTSDWPK